MTHDLFTFPPVGRFPHNLLIFFLSVPLVLSLHFLRLFGACFSI